METIIEESNSYKIAILSYNRPSRLEKKTYKLLKEYGLLDNVILFLSTEKDIEDYKYLNLKSVLSPKGYTETCNFISEYFDEDEPYILMGDDVDKFTKFIGNYKQEKVEDLDKLFIETFSMMKDKKLNLGGFYPTPNPMALNSVKPEDTTSTYLAFIHDAVCLIVNKKIMLDPYVLKVDFQRTIEYYKLDGGVLRRNNYSFKTYFMKGKGGNELEKQNEEEYSKRFYEKYKDYIKYKRIHKSGSSSYILNKKGRKIAKVN